MPFVQHVGYSNCRLKRIQDGLLFILKLSIAFCNAGAHLFADEMNFETEVVSHGDIGM